MKQPFFNQFLPILLTIATCIFLVLGIYLVIFGLNLLPIQDKIVPSIRWPDILVGLTIYLKTSIDFALFLGNLMQKYQGVKNRIAIELGTACGNGLGTAVILCIWTFFKEIPILLVLMIFLAAIVLFRMAEESLEELLQHYSPPPIIKSCVKFLIRILAAISRVTKPVTSFILPSSPLIKGTNKTFSGLLVFSLTIPFILGLDDFAGYIPLFSLVDIFGFATGVFFGHMLLTTSLFAAPSITVKVVKHPVVVLFGSVAFISIASLGIIEAAHLLQGYFFPR